MLFVVFMCGIIYDCNGILLVCNVIWYDIVVMFYKIVDMDVLLKQFFFIVDFFFDDIVDFCYVLKFSSCYCLVVFKNVLMDVEIVCFVVNQFYFNGVMINSYQDWQYFYGVELVYVFGYVLKINDNDFKVLDKKGLVENYVVDYNIGKQGIECYYENDFYGKIGYQEVEVDNYGCIVCLLKDVFFIVGKNIYLMLDFYL